MSGPDRALEEARRMLDAHEDVFTCTLPDGELWVEGSLSVIVSTFLGALRRELPEAAVRATAIALYPTERDESLDAEAADGIRAFLAALTGEGPDEG